jgi:hypothetical protein
MSKAYSEAYMMKSNSLESIPRGFVDVLIVVSQFNLMSWIEEVFDVK